MRDRSRTPTLITIDLDAGKFPITVGRTVALAQRRAINVLIFEPFAILFRETLQGAAIRQLGRARNFEAVREEPDWVALGDGSDYAYGRSTGLAACRGKVLYVNRDGRGRSGQKSETRCGDLHVER